MVYREQAVAALKHANKIEERLVNTFRESIRFLGVERFWKLRRQPFEYVLLDDDGAETDVSIKFTGCDNPENLKSFKARRGSFRYVWFEEATNFGQIREVNNLIQTFARGFGKHTIILTYNPPIQSSNWVNREFSVPRGEVYKRTDHAVYSEYLFKVVGLESRVRQVVHHSTYLDVIAAGHADWLGSQFIGDAERYRETNETYYRWAYLGEVVGTNANVFPNVRTFDRDKFDLPVREVFRGFDWGYGGPDPCAYSEWMFDRPNKRIYCLGEFGTPGMSIEDIVAEMKVFNKHNFPVFADSAVPLLNRQLLNSGLNIEDVKKGPDSVRAGVKWLQSLTGIFIDPCLTPNVYREFQQYEYIVDRDDNVTSGLPDANNHWIDSTRYALSLEIKYNLT